MENIDFIDPTAKYLQETTLGQQNTNENNDDEPKDKSGRNENRDKD